jgi:hypothetical protein
MLKYTVTCEGVGVTNNYGFWITWLDLMGVYVTFTVNYKSSHTELLLNDVCLTNQHDEPRTDLTLHEGTNPLPSINAREHNTDHRLQGSH